MKTKVKPLASHGSITLPWRTLLLAAVATLLYILFGAASNELVLQQQGLQQGEFWRLFSGHFIHSDLQHFALNITALLVLGLLFEQHLKHHLFASMLLSCLVVSFWVLNFMPELLAYCGLSGILNTFMVMGVLSLWYSKRSNLLLVVLGLMLLKNLYELNTQQALFSATAWPAVPEAHIVGMATGALLWLMHLQTPAQAIRSRAASAP